VIYDDANIRLENFIIDVSGAQDGACSPILAGIYVRNAVGMFKNVAIRGAALPTRPDCDSGVGLLVRERPHAGLCASRPRPVGGERHAGRRRGASGGSASWRPARRRR
jgi:hypothetical protein